LTIAQIIDQPITKVKRRVSSVEEADLRTAYTTTASSMRSSCFYNHGRPSVADRRATRTSADDPARFREESACLVRRFRSYKTRIISRIERLCSSV
jgi:hypothetical protein